MEKKEMSLPTVMYPEVIQPSTTQKESKSTSLKKTAIISVAVLIGLGLILGSVLLAVHLMAEKDDSHYEKQKTITVDDKDGKKTQEKMYVNTKTKEETFETSKISVVHDFNKGLTIIKTLDNKDQYVCHLTTLNSTGMMNPAEMEKALSSNEVSDPKDDDKVQTQDEKFQQTAVKVNNREFLSPKSKEMCDGYPIYWMIPTGDASPREKRSCFWYCYYYYRYYYYYGYYRYRRCFVYC